MNEQPPGPGRLVGLDALRGIAALLVLLFHYTTRFDQVHGHSSILPVTVPWGGLGVNLFFMISGFVIFMTLDRLRRPSDFIVSRFSRLYPVYWVAVVLTFSIEWLSPHVQSIPVGEALANGLMFHGLLGARHVDGVYWTLEVELLFYFWMFVLWLSNGFKHPLWFIAGWLALALATSLAQRVLGLSVPYTVSHLLLLAHIPYFILGMLLYLLQQGQRLRPVPAYVMIAATLVALGLMEGLQGAIIATGFTALVWTAIRFCDDGLGKSQVLAWLGAISYPLYLVHQDIGYAVMLQVEKSGGTSWLAVLVASAVALILATLLHRVIEYPAMHRIRGWYKRRAGRQNQQLGAAFSRYGWLAFASVALLILVTGNRIALALAQ